MDIEPKEQKQPSRKEKYNEVFDATLEAINNPDGGAEYLVSLGQDMDEISVNAADSDKIRSTELLLRNFVNLGNYNDQLFEAGQTAELIQALILSTSDSIGFKDLAGSAHRQLEQLQVAYADANAFPEGKELASDHFETTMGIHAFALNEAVKYGADPSYYRGNIASAVSQLY